MGFLLWAIWIPKPYSHISLPWQQLSNNQWGFLVMLAKDWNKPLKFCRATCPGLFGLYGFLQKKCDFFLDQPCFPVVFISLMTTVNIYNQFASQYFFTYIYQSLASLKYITVLVTSYLLWYVETRICPTSIPWISMTYRTVTYSRNKDALAHYYRVRNVRHASAVSVRFFTDYSRNVAMCHLDALSGHTSCERADRAFQQSWGLQ